MRRWGTRELRLVVCCVLLYMKDAPTAPPPTSNPPPRQHSLCKVPGLWGHRHGINPGYQLVQQMHIDAAFFTGRMWILCFGGTIMRCPCSA